jgi:2-dehydropantoate 2-reductase
MRIAIVGAGAIGGYLAVKVARAGETVCCIARGAQLAAIRARGLRLIEPGNGEIAAPEIRGYARPAEAGPQDLIFLTLKAHQVPSVAAELIHLCEPDTAIVTMQNGIPWWYFHKLGGPYADHRLQSVDPGGLIADHVNPDRIVGSVVYPAAILSEPGTIRLIEGNRFGLGELSGGVSDRLQRIAKLLIGAGLRAPITHDIRAEIWHKLWGNLCFNPISALSHAMLSDICTFEPTRTLARAMMREAEMVANKLGVTFKIGIEQRISGAERVGAHKTSMLQDVELGRPLELQALVGSVLELARLTDTPTPNIAAIHACTALLAKMLEAKGSGLQLRAKIAGAVR